MTFPCLLSIETLHANETDVRDLAHSKVRYDFPNEFGWKPQGINFTLKTASFRGRSRILSNRLVWRPPTRSVLRQTSGSGPASQVLSSTIHKGPGKARWDWESQAPHRGHVDSEYRFRETFPAVPNVPLETTSGQWEEQDKQEGGMTPPSPGTWLSSRLGITWGLQTGLLFFGFWHQA